MNLIDADVADGRVSFADISFELPPSSAATGLRGRFTLGIRPTDFDHAVSADPQLPRIRVKPDVVEDLGSEHHVIFTLDAPRVTAEAVRAASDEQEDEGKLFADDRAVFTAAVDARRAISSDSEIDLAVDHARLHFFDPATGLALAGAPSSSLVAS
jgi:multiple sugar transport system ATP-binding protein